MSTFVVFLGAVCGIWTQVVFVVQLLGVYRLFRNYSKPPPKAASEVLENDRIPHVNILRPVKGIEPQLYECLASTLRQTYPKNKLTLHLCVGSYDDPAYPILQRIVSDFPDCDVRLYVEAEDPVLHSAEGHVHNLGPNPKIRNISRAYREAKGDVIWIIDCNIWVPPGVAGRMVDKLYGFQHAGGGRLKPFKLVHQLPLVVDISAQSIGESEQLLSSASEMDTISNSATRSQPQSAAMTSGGGRLEEMFMATAHAKFYLAINAVSVAPCIIGKSTMFRKSHLDRMTDPAQNPILSDADADRGRGIDFFSSNICEDQLLGDLIWRSDIPGYRNHGLAAGDVAIQPMAGMSVPAYVGRRVRWLRVRKWTVTVATLVEPGVECLLCCFYFAFAATTVPIVREALGLSATWASFALCWVCSVTAWIVVDYFTYALLHACQTVTIDDDTPAFARGAGRRGGVPRKPFGEWLLAWFGREILALPIWIWACLLGTTVTWRGKRFRVGMDMRVVELDAAGNKTSARVSNGRPPSRKNHAD